MLKKDFQKLSSAERKVYTGVLHWENGDCEYYKNGECHRDDGPAVIWNSGTKFYYQNGKLHRIDGPARIWPDGVEYYINGVETTKEGQELYHSLIKLKSLG